MRRLTPKEADKLARLRAIGKERDLKVLRKGNRLIWHSLADGHVIMSLPIRLIILDHEE